MNLVKATFGVGIVSLPYFFCQTGIVLGAVMICLCALANALSLHLLGACVIKANSEGKEASFHALAQYAFGGNRIASALSPLCIILEAYGIAAAFFICVGDIIPEVAEYFGASDSWNSRYFWITVIGWFIEFPLSCLNSMDALKYSSTIGNFGILYLTALFCIFGFGGFDLSPVEQTVTLWPPAASSHTSTSAMIEAIPVFIFIFICSLNLPALVLELGEITFRRMDIMIIPAMSLVAAAYILVGVCGSVAFGASVGGNAMISFPNKQGTWGGLVSIVARVAVVLNLMGSIPLYVFPMRANVAKLFCGKPMAELTAPKRFGLALLCFLSVWCQAMVASDLKLMMAFVGSSAHLASGFVLPTLFYLYYYLAPSNQDKDTVGVALQARSPAIEFETGISFSQNTSNLRRTALAMLVIGIVLAPFLLTVEISNALNET